MATPRHVKSGAVLAAAAVVAATGYYLFSSEANHAAQTTDDAYVSADATHVASRVAGVVETVEVEDNQRVTKGQLLATLDARDFRVALDAAKARLATAQAAGAVLDAQLRQQQDLIAQARATLASDRASLDLAQANAVRYRNLAADGSGTRQERQTAEAQLGIQTATSSRDEAALSAAQQQVGILQARKKQSDADIEQAQAAVAAAGLQLSYTRITAPIEGIIGRREVRVGQYADVATPLLAVVPLQSAYVDAHFRETQLTRIRPGQPADIRVDTLPGVSLKGHVDSIAPATGVSFSPIVPDNATGNFTKVVQRLAVKIVLDPGQQDASRLKVGMSVEPTIRVD